MLVNKVHKIVVGHASNNYHFHDVHDALDYWCSIEMNIDVRTRSALFPSINENTIKYCGKCILQQHI